MSFINKLRKGVTGAMNALNADEYRINNIAIKCTHCGHQHFEHGEAQLNTAFMTFVGLDWANDSATILSCKACSYIMWFTNKAEKIN